MRTISHRIIDSRNLDDLHVKGKAIKLTEESGGILWIKKDSFLEKANPPKSGQSRKVGKEGNSPKEKPKWLRTRGDAHVQAIHLILCVCGKDQNAEY